MSGSASSHARAGGDRHESERAARRQPGGPPPLLRGGAAGSPAQRIESDAVLLTNSDRVVGKIAGLSGGALELSTEAGTVRLPLSRADAVVFGSSRQPATDGRQQQVVIGTGDGTLLNATSVIAGEKAARTPRFVKTSNGTRTLDEASLARARRLAGLKGYVTNIATEKMAGQAVISAYHDLWQVEASFRMTKSDLKARPVFHHQRDSIEAHLTVVFAALAISRHLHKATGVSIKKIVQTLRTIRSATIEVNGQQLTIKPKIPQHAKDILDAIQGH